MFKKNATVEMRTKYYLMHTARTTLIWRQAVYLRQIHRAQISFLLVKVTNVLNLERFHFINITLTRNKQSVNPVLIKHATSRCWAWVNLEYSVSSLNNTSCTLNESTFALSRNADEQYGCTYVWTDSSSSSVARRDWNCNINVQCMGVFEQDLVLPSV